MPAIAQAIFELYPLAPKPVAMPQYNRYHASGRHGPLLLVGALSGTRTTGWAASTTLSDPRTACSDVTTSRMPIKASPIRARSLATMAFRDIRKSTTNKISTPPSKSGTCFRRRYSTKPVSGSCGLTCLTADGGLNGTKNALDPVPGRRLCPLLPAEGLRQLVRCPRDPSQDAINRFSVGDDVTMTRGAHNLHFGPPLPACRRTILVIQVITGGW